MTEPNTKTTKSTNRLVGFLRQLVGLRAERSAATASRQPAPRRDFAMPLTALAPSAHLDRVSAIVQVSFLRVKSVNGCQALARQQLDVADYALQAILNDLRAVMPGQFAGPQFVTLAPANRAATYPMAHARIAA
jgi:hypothetical protein